MKHAKKLDIKFDVELKHSDVVVSGYGVVHGVPRIVNKYIPKKISTQFKKYLPEDIHKNIIGVYFSDIQIVGPHVHTADKSVINWYLKTGGEITSFYEGDYIQDDRYVTDNNNRYYAVDMDHISQIEYFIARDDDVWLLNTTTAHSVSLSEYQKGMNPFYEQYYKDTSPTHFKYVPSGNSRKAVQIFFDLPYEEMIQYF